MAMTKAKQERLRDEFAMAALTGLYANSLVVDKAHKDWCESGGSRPTCIAEWITGLAYEAADAAMNARLEPKES